jgi:NAD(P)H-flavin reductase
MLGLPGVGEVPISISGQSGSSILHTIRAVGATTRALDGLTPGAALTIRGPFGRGWPMAEAVGRNVTVIAGGLGLAPLRGAIREMLDHPDRYPAVRLLYGARSPADIVYDREMLGWSRDHAHFKLSTTVDHAEPGWTGHVGVVTTLMSRKELSPHGVFFVCGPEIMMRFVVKSLLGAGIPSERIWLSMERNMKCAAGICGRCQYGPHFVCKDGPVFRHDEIVDLFGRKGF